jgi:hypothetical protein
MKMLKKLKFSSLVLLVLFLLAIIFAAFFYFGAVKPGTEATPAEEPLITDEFLMMGYVYFIVALCLSLYVAVRGLVKNSASLKNILISTGVFLGIIIFSFLISTGNLIPGFTSAGNTPSVIRLVDTGLKAAYIFGGLALAGIVYTEIAGMLRSNQ